ncbi:cytochrome c [Terasakiella sp. SH-1]|uniref:c-type cytochrome n=1 Tax=Terasakiella sp. SH-1 TaxID=2560057 RepID=UPI00143134FA|nr:cytochrome c [Terasakiella sp. SH-1]
MFKFPVSKALMGLALGGVLVTTAACAGDELKYGFGVKPTKAEIAGWDIDARPDGLGLPPGSGGYEEGEELFQEQCAVCHGEFADGGGGRYPPLVGGDPEHLSQEASPGQPEKTIGSYWPYASTVFDYIKRAMPFGNAQSLTDDEVYAITNFLMVENGLHDEDQPMDAKALAAIKMPNEGGFFMDPRPDTKNPHCMKDCYKSVDITSKATLGVTPTGEDALR